MSNFKKIANKKLCVIGAGLSGVWAAILAKEKKARVFLSEGIRESLPAEHSELLNKYNIRYETGGHTKKIENADIYIISPGIPKDSKIYQQLKSFAKPVISEIEFASWFIGSAKIIAVTGTNGKSTTVRLIDHLFAGSKYNHQLGGNIGIPFSKLVIDTENFDKNKIFILEISSFQMEDIIDFRPYISIILNITPDHLNRYNGKLAKYLEAKLQIAANQTEDEYYYYFSREKLLRNNLPENTNTIPYDKNCKYKDLIQLQNNGRIKTIDGDLLKIRGKHNYYNTLAALSAIEQFQLEQDRILANLKSFTGLAHRLEFVRSINGIEFYNDSKATNIDSVIQALKSFKNNIILILGGRDKDLDFKELIPYLKKNTKKIILIGEASEKIRNQIAGTVPMEKVNTMREVVDQAYNEARPGEVVLLAPGCASFDMYENYKHRGQDFKSLVNELEK
jgi:UDP-N-acetylmuramoylalanine--D-glutamate ligase